MPRSQKQDKKPRHDPLYTQIDKDEVEAKYGRISQPGKRQKPHKTDDDNDGDVLLILVSWFTSLSFEYQVILDPKTSRRIFELARDQQDELEISDEVEGTSDDGDKSAFTTLRPPIDEDNDEESNTDLDGETGEEEFVSDSNFTFRAYDSQDPKKIAEEDLHTLGALLPENSYERRTLADVIFSKLDNAKGNATAAIQRVKQGALPMPVKIVFWFFPR